MKTKNAPPTPRSNNLLESRLMNVARFGLPMYLVACGVAGVQDPNSSADLDAPTRNPNSPFEARRMDHSGPPVLKVINLSDITANVDCSGASEQSIVVPAGERREVQIPAGSYSCMLHGGSATPHTWSETYESGVQYTFSARTQTRPM